MGATVGFQELTFSSIPEPATSIYGDISAGGLLLSSTKELTLGTILKLEMRVPGWGRHQNHFGPPQDQDNRPLVAVGQVVRIETLDAGDYEIGIKFLNVYPDDQEALKKFIAASAPAED